MAKHGKLGPMIKARRARTLKRQKPLTGSPGVQTHNVGGSLVVPTYKKVTGRSIIQGR